MKVTLLGTGTSTGVPAIGCACSVCRSTDPQNRRTRPSALIENDGHSLLIDTAPDFRLQALREGIQHLDAILFTHHHADHILGLDDIRPLNFAQKAAIPCYGSPETLAEIRITFRYIFMDNYYGGLPQVTTHAIVGPFDLCGLRIVPLPLLHARLPVLGFRIGGFAYMTDVSRIPDATWSLIGGLEVLVLGALRHEPHPAHFTLEEAVDVAGKIGARRTYFTHIAHDLEHRAINAQLPEGTQLGHDGLAIEL